MKFNLKTLRYLFWKEMNEFQERDFFYSNNHKGNNPFWEHECFLFILVIPAWNINLKKSQKKPTETQQSNSNRDSW